MSFSAIVSHTPLWVWLMLGFVVSRGVNALTPREVVPLRVLIVPTIFLLWGLFGLMGGGGGVSALALFALALAVGGVAGRGLASLAPAPRWDRETGMLAMPGSPIPLILIVVAFAAKYVGGVALAVTDEPGLHAQIAQVMTIVGGLFAGLFWGRTLFQFQRASRASGGAGDLAAIRDLVLGRTAPTR